MTDKKMTLEEKLEIAENAIGYVLLQVRNDPRLAWHFVMSEKHHRLVRAFAALTDTAEAEVTDRFDPPATEAPAWSRQEMQDKVREMFREAMNNGDLPEGMRLVDTDEEDVEVEWPARDHETFVWPILQLNLALERFGLRCELSPLSNPGTYRVIVGVCS